LILGKEVLTMEDRWRLSRNRWKSILRYIFRKAGLDLYFGFLYCKNIDKKSNIENRKELDFKTYSRKNIDNIPKRFNNFRDYLSRETFVCFLIKNNNILGYSFITLDKTYVREFGKDVNLKKINGGFIWKVKIFEKYRNRGLGKYMIKKTISNFKNSFNLQRMYCVVEFDNIPSRKLFESCGFTIETC